MDQVRCSGWPPPGLFNRLANMNWARFRGGGGKCSLSPYFLKPQLLPRAGQVRMPRVHTHLCPSGQDVWSRLSLWAF